MKYISLILIMVLFSVTTTNAQEKPTNDPVVTEKANHNTTRSNRKRSGIASPDTNSGDDEQAGIFERRKCIRSGGTYYELPNGNKFCMPARQNADKSKTIATEPMPGGIFERRKCLKAGGIWLTNANGSMCMKKIESSSRKM